MSYAFRTRKSSPTLTHVADLFGRTREVSPYLRGPEQCAAFGDLAEPEAPPADEPCPRCVRNRLQALIAATVASYEASGRFTETELRTIRALWIEQLSLRAFARREGASVEAVRSRIEGNSRGQGGLGRKADAFYRWWAYKHRNRRKGTRRVSRTHHRQSAQSVRHAA